jgi:asparagine synthase (glutamine-hydrolysing)
MSMAWGLELRVPLVDRKLAECMGRVPAKSRLAGGKRLFLDAVPEIPAWIADRPKRGFSFPFQKWISHEWREVFGEIDRKSPVHLGTWYRQWALFVLEHSLRKLGFNDGAAEPVRETMVTR